VVALVVIFLSGGTLSGQGRTAAKSIRIAVIGESNLKTNFIEDLKAAGEDVQLQIDIVPRGGTDLNYTVIIAQESTIGSAAGAVIALDSTAR